MLENYLFKMLLTGDWHCGDKAGLTPPSQISNDKYSALQRQLWDWFAVQIPKYGPYDMTLFMGDMVEGQNNKNTIELYEPDTEEQAEIAAECASIIPCKRSSMYTVYGTPFHTAGTYSYENHFCDTLGIARPKTTQRINIDDLVRVNARHTVGRSGMPYGQGTPTFKEMVNELIDAVNKEDVVADFLARAHAHYSVSMKVGNRESVVVPAMKYPGSIYGRRLPESQYDMGFGVLYVYGKKSWVYVPVLVPFEISGRREWTKWEGICKPESQ